MIKNVISNPPFILFSRLFPPQLGGSNLLFYLYKLKKLTYFSPNIKALHMNKPKLLIVFTREL